MQTSAVEYILSSEEEANSFCFSSDTTFKKRIQIIWYLLSSCVKFIFVGKFELKLKGRLRIRRQCVMAAVEYIKQYREEHLRTLSRSVHLGLPPGKAPLTPEECIDKEKEERDIRVFLRGHQAVLLSDQEINTAFAIIDKGFIPCPC